MASFPEIFCFGQYPISSVILKNASEFESDPTKPKNETTYARSDLTSIKAVSEAFSKHFSGEAALSVGPVQKSTVSGEQVCRWGVLDFDDYAAFDDGTLSKTEILSQLSTHIPAVGVDTKKGGMHAWFFFREEIPSSLVRIVLSKLAESLGIGKDKIEVFPKSDEGPPHGFSPCISLPYFGPSPKRVARNERGLALDMATFAALCVSAQIPTERMTELSEKPLMENPLRRTETGEQRSPPPARAQASSLTKQRRPAVWELLRGPGGVYSGPPCLPTMLAAGIGQSRNDVFYSVCVYLRMAWMDAPGGREEAESRALSLYDLSVTRMVNGDAFERYEAQAAFSSAWKSSTGYKCDTIQGLLFDAAAACDGKRIKKKCMMRKHGLNIGEYADLRELFVNFRIVTDGSRSHALFVVRADPRELVVTLPCENIYQFDMLKQAILRRCAISVSIERQLIKDGTWEWFVEDLVNNCIDRVLVENADYEASLRTVLKTLLERSSLSWMFRGHHHSPDMAVVSQDGEMMYFTRYAVERIITVCSQSVIDLFKSGILSAALSQVAEKTMTEVVYAGGETVSMFAVAIKRNKLLQGVTLASRTINRPTDETGVVNHFEEEMKRMRDSEVDQ